MKLFNTSICGSCLHTREQARVHLLVDHWSPGMGIAQRKDLIFDNFFNQHDYDGRMWRVVTRARRRPNVPVGEI